MERQLLPLATNNLSQCKIASIIAGPYCVIAAIRRLLAVFTILGRTVLSSLRSKAIGICSMQHSANSLRNFL